MATPLSSLVFRTALKKRMQGKACFNFKTVDPNLFKALDRLTKEGYACFKKIGYI